MSLSNKRIVNDIAQFIKNGYNDKFIYFDKSNFTEIYSMIIGPKGTPYENGMFFFKIVFPSNYPYSSPKVEFLNKNPNVRIHPNLYSCGKVCLSILGTWAGPSWEPCMSLDTVLQSIQSLLNENPLNNEPAWYNSSIENESCKEYSIFCTYQKYQLLFIDVIDNKFIHVSQFFEKEIKEHIKNSIKHLSDNLLTYIELYGNYTLKTSPYCYNLKKFNFNDLQERITSIMSEYI